jgi:hypothetical protein
MITNFKPAGLKMVRTNLYTDGVKLATTDGDFLQRQMGISAEATIEKIFARDGVRRHSATLGNNLKRLPGV